MFNFSLIYYRTHRYSHFKPLTRFVNSFWRLQWLFTFNFRAINSKTYKIWPEKFFENLLNNLFWSHQCMYGYEIFTQYTFIEFPDFYLSGILIFSFLGPKAAIFKIFGRGELRKRPKNWKKGKNQNSAEIKVWKLTKGILCENFIYVHALMASE